MYVGCAMYVLIECMSFMYVRLCSSVCMYVMLVRYVMVCVYVILCIRVKL